jgi:hypothetical protein
MDGQKSLARTLVIGAASIGLASCGGGGSSSPMTVPVVAATPVIPTGTFLGSQNSGTFTGSTDNVTLAAGANNTITTGVASNSATAASVTLTTDATTGQTRFLALSVPLGNGSTFSDTIDLTTAVKAANNFVEVQQNPNTAAANLFVIDPTLNFATYGIWISASTPSAGGFAVGSMTPLAAITPSLGTATYSGGVVGAGVDHINGTLLALEGTFSLSANFSAMTVSGTFNINDLTNGTTFGNLTMPSTSITAATGGPFSGTLTGNLEDGNPVTTSDVNGHFFGPTANETAGTFSAANTNFQAVGAFGGKKQ